MHYIEGCMVKSVSGSQISHTSTATPLSLRRSGQGIGKAKNVPSQIVERTGFLNKVSNFFAENVLNAAKKAVNFNYSPDFESRIAFIEEKIGKDVVGMGDWIAGVVCDNVEFDAKNGSVTMNYLNGWINDYIDQDKNLIKKIAQSVIYDALCKLIKDVEGSDVNGELTTQADKRLAVLEKFLSLILVDEPNQKTFREIQAVEDPKARDAELNLYFQRVSSRLMTYAFPNKFEDIELPNNLKMLLSTTMGWERLQGKIEGENGKTEITGLGGILKRFYQNDFKEFFDADMAFVKARDNLPKILGKLREYDNPIRNPAALRPEESPHIKDILHDLAKGFDNLIQKNFNLARGIIDNSKIKKVLESLAPKGELSEKWNIEAQAFADKIGEAIDHFVENNEEHPLWNFVLGETDDALGFFVERLIKNAPHMGPIGPHNLGKEDLLKRVTTKVLTSMEKHIRNLNILQNANRKYLFGKPEQLPRDAFKAKSDEEFYPAIAKRILAVFFPNGATDLPIPEGKQVERWAMLEEAAVSGMKSILSFFTDPQKRNELFITLIRARREAALKDQGQSVPMSYPPIPETFEESKKALVEEALAWRDTEFSNRAVWSAIQNWLDDLIVKNFGILWPVKQKLDKVSRFIFFTVIRSMIKIIIFPVLYLLEVIWKWRNRQWISSVVDMIVLSENKKIVQEMTEIFLEMLEKDYPNKQLTTTELDIEFSAACRKVVGSTLRIHPHRELQPLLMLFLGKGSEITEGTLNEMVDAQGMSPIEVLLQFGGRILKA